MINRVFAGRYRITEKIGIGGMAEVYKATDETLGRTVAVKVMLPQYAADETFAARFKQEARAAANLQSPYIVNIYDWGFEESSSTYYIIMEYIRGTDLKTAITQRGAINQRKVAEIGAQVAAALGVAHSYDVIHRDIKPQNIMVQPDGNAKVMDFGIARSNNANMTQTGSVLGTAYYVSPEQAQGKPLTAATDIYSLGVVLYESVTGRVPFDGPDAVSIAVKQVNEMPVPPRAIDNSIDPSLEAIILKALNKHPADRFSTADEMRLALTEFLQGKPLSGVDPNARTRVMAAPAVIPPAQATAVMPQLATASTYVRAGDSNGRQQESNTTRRTLVVSLVSVLVILLAAVALYFAFCTGPGEEAGEVEVPNLAGKTQEEAEALIQAAGLEIGEVKVESSSTIPEGQVSSQNPAALTKVKEGSKVNFVISGGPDNVSVPDLSNKTQEEAKAEVEALGLVYAEGTPKPDPNIEAGRVISQNPSFGGTVKKGQTITVIISTGVEVVQIPNVSNMAQAVAEAALANFVIAYTDPVFHPTIPEGSVVTQDKVGEGKKGDTVTLTLSKGPEPTEGPVPNVVGKTVSAAENELRGAGFAVAHAASEVYSATVPAGSIVSQDKTMAMPGDTITLTISKGPEPTPPPNSGATTP